MNEVFVDTAAWIALLNTNDALHTQALQIRATLRNRRTPLLTTDFVFLEVADGFCSPEKREQAIALINRMRTAQNLQVIPVSAELFERGWNLYCQRPDKGWGLTDCISFVVMMQEGITQAFTSDRHFEQAGFTKLL